ncbi:hypothetical protein HYV84_00090 [Candidatus Woesearchaeota archaeon]|nr:hypothetical protein [Candidatus Woesearchaeota archaeon]
MKKKKDSLKPLKIIGWIVLIYFLIFFIFRPFQGAITEDSPFMRTLCKMQAACHAGSGPYSCSPRGENKELEKWKGYKGCNESTNGYETSSNNRGYINVESCNCGGLM